MMDILQVIDGGVFEPCEISLRISDTDTRVYACQSSFRLLPGRRLTALAISEGKKYVIKIFPQRHRSLEEYERELSGHELLHSVSIETAPMIYHGPAEENVNIIIYKYIDRARTLLEVFDQRPDSRQQVARLDLFARLLSLMHDRHLIHEDPHLGNFLLKGGVITVLDAGAVRRVGNATLTEKNYGLVVAQFPVSWNIESRFYHAYRGPDNLIDYDEDRLHKQVQSHKKWREKHYLKKIFRECSAFHVHSSMFGKMIVDRDFMHTGLRELLDDPRHLFDGDQVEMLKEGKSSTVGVVKLGDQRFVIKRYNVKSKMHQIKQMLKESRASRSWRNAHRMILRGFTTARPVAVLECLKGRLKGVSVFVMQYVEGVNSANYFLDKKIDIDSKRATAKKMLELIQEMHHERIIHGDLKSTNFIIGDKGIVIIDLDSMKVVGSQANIKAAISKEMKRFNKNWQENSEAQSIFDELIPSYTQENYR
ncbi:MAG TPA: lipopolysaccharide core heptose(II) kinase RfaY [Gammaproteobacteria bacterium]